MEPKLLYEILPASDFGHLECGAWPKSLQCRRGLYCNWLSALFSEKLSVAEKIDIINNEYDIPVANNIMEEVNIMCNLSQGIEDRALEAGKVAAQIDIILNMYKNNFTVEQIALATQHKVDEIKEIIKNN